MNDVVHCIFCLEPIGDDAVFDICGEIACRECGDAEIEAQKQEGFWPLPAPPQQKTEQPRSQKDGSR